jgi:hypothetical protein
MIQNLCTGQISTPTVVLLTFGPFPEGSLVRGVYVTQTPGTFAGGVPMFVSAALSTQRLASAAEFLIATPNLMQGSAQTSVLIGPNVSPPVSGTAYLALNLRTNVASFLTIAVLGGTSAGGVSVSLDADVPPMSV